MEKVIAESAKEKPETQVPEDLKRLYYGLMVQSCIEAKLKIYNVTQIIERLGAAESRVRELEEQRERFLQHIIQTAIALDTKAGQNNKERATEIMGENAALKAQLETAKQEIKRI